MLSPQRVTSLPRTQRPIRRRKFMGVLYKGAFKARASLLVSLFAALLSACTTVPKAPDAEPPMPPAVVVTPIPQVTPVPESSPAPAPSPIPAPIPTPETPRPLVEIIPAPAAPTPVNPEASAIANLAGWRDSDVTPALVAFNRSCGAWSKELAGDYLNAALPEYGTYGDWASACEAAKRVNIDYGSAHDFFERYFDPVHLAPRAGERGLLTGYYQPEIEVRRRADAYFNEPILAVPKSKAAQKLPRSKIGPTTSRVIAYGRPMDVFFMQIQGSGHIRFKDGATVRAAYAGNNGYNYKSIGKVLIDRGEITKDKSSKRDIEAWMAKAGPKKSRELMNENKRYIFFVEQKIEIGEGPNGAMRVPLTGMGSMAVDPHYHPYGALIWLNVKLPMSAGDYRGTEQGVLLAAQDTGKAIRGALRGDIYFGSGKAAGQLAGVMKHSGDWYLLLPKQLASRLKAQAGIS